MTKRGPIDAVSGDSADTQVYVQQEGAYVVLSMNWSEDKTHSVLLTPELAEALSYSLMEEGKNARGFAQ